MTPELYQVVTPPAPAPRQHSHSLSSCCSTPLPGPTVQGLASGGGPNPDPGDAAAGDAATRQLSWDQLMRRPVLDSTRGEADYGYSELDYYTAAGGSSTPQPATQTVPNTVTNVSAGNQDQGRLRVNRARIYQLWPE